jgi:hypothetical protein
MVFLCQRCFAGFDLDDELLYGVIEPRRCESCFELVVPDEIHPVADGAYHDRRASEWKVEFR